MLTGSYQKDRCDGQRPACTACMNAQQVCCYEPSTKKRGLPEGYVRGLEKLYALLMGKIEGFDEAASRLLNENRVTLSKLWNHQSAGEDLHTTWKESKILSELEALLSSLEQTSTNVGHKRKREQDDDGSPSENEPDLTYHLRACFAMSEVGPGGAGQALKSTRDAPVSISLPQQSPQILNHYFAHTHCWFPILPRSDLTRACYELTRGNVSESSRNQLPLLWAVLAYSVSQIRSTQIHYMSAEVQSLPQVQDLKAQSIRLIPGEAESCTIVHAQSLLLLSLLEIGLSNWRSAWAMVGKAIRITLNVLSENKPPQELVTTVMQGCIVLDVTIASHLKSVPHLRRHDVQSMHRLPEDGREEWEPWSGPDGFRSQQEPSFSISCFNRLTEILLILCDGLTIGLPSTTLTKEHMQDLLAQLHQLQKTFSASMPPSAHSPPHQIYLQLCHVSTQICLVELALDSDVGASERAKLACNVLSLFNLCHNADAIGLAHIPPFFVDGFSGALRLANSSKSAFGPDNRLPTFSTFQSAASDLLDELSSMWPAFATVTRQVKDNLILGPKTTSLQPRSSKGRNNLDSGPRAVSPAWMLGNTSASQRGEARFGAVVNEFDLDIVDIGPTPGALAPASVVATAQPNMMTDGQGFPRLPNSFDLDMMSSQPPGPIDPALIGTSPSFHGDEIDAIFREMAHLDTNEWNTERATGLKDFGFTDDLTFQAFCNDPDRLMDPSEGNQHTLSSNAQTWMFTGDVPQDQV